MLHVPTITSFVFVTYHACPGKIYVNYILYILRILCNEPGWSHTNFRMCRYQNQESELK